MKSREYDVKSIYITVMLGFLDFVCWWEDERISGK